MGNFRNLALIGTYIWAFVLTSASIWYSFDSFMIVALLILSPWMFPTLPELALPVFGNRRRLLMLMSCCVFMVLAVLTYYWLIGEVPTRERWIILGTPLYELGLYGISRAVFLMRAGRPPEASAFVFSHDVPLSDGVFNGIMYVFMALPALALIAPMIDTGPGF